MNELKLLTHWFGASDSQQQPARHTGLLYALILTAIVGIISSPLKAIGQDREELPLFQLLSPSESGITFSNYIIESDTFYMGVYIYAYNGSGVAIGDINGDDLPDIYLLGTQAHSPSRLYLNQGGMHFQDISEASGLLDSNGIRFGVTMVDIDADGDLDLYVCRQNRPNSLYINNGNLTFTDRAAGYGLDYCCSSTQASFFDYDRDGDLDLYLGINGKAFEREPMIKGLSDQFFRNDNGHFTNVTETTGIHDQGYALSVSVSDINDDGWPDVYVTNDFQERDILYINNQDGTFTDRMEQLMRHTSGSSMGSEIADFNNDGRLDIVALDMMPENHWRKMANVGNMSTFSPTFDSTQLNRNTLQLNRGDGFFSDVAQLAGVSETDWSWAPILFDADNDGDKDLFITNGFKRDVLNLDIMQYFNPHNSRLQLLQQVPEIRLPNYLYRNNGNVRFTNMTSRWGVDQVVNSNGVAYGDLDRDGDLDLVVNNLDSTAFVFENKAADQNRGNWLQIELIGKGQNPGGIGTRVNVFTGTVKQTQEMMPFRGYLSSVDYLLHFGIGLNRTVDSVEVIWGDGSRQLIKDVGSNRRLRLQQKNARSESSPKLPAYSNPVFRQIDSRSIVPFVHHEELFIDFHYERLLPRRFSQDGPGMATGDINGDGRTDLWIGGAAGQMGGIFLQTADSTGECRLVNLPGLLDSAQEMNREDLGGLLVDVDNDSDLDLYIVAGSNEVPAGDGRLQDRLYLNNGKGTFEYVEGALPLMNENGSMVSAADYDKDGDLDLFVCGSVVPGSYPDPARSYLLRNDKGVFTDVTAEVAPELMHPGILTAALWTDYDNDNDVDLIIIGEWMSPRLFNNHDTKLSEITSGTGLEGHEGWWNSLVGGDFDNDGDIDYVLGNQGLNTKPELRASHEFPLQLYANDFDENGSRDLIVSYFFQGREYPSRNKMDAASQMGTYIKRKFPGVIDYSTATIPQIYSAEKLQSSIHLTATTMESMYAENLGDGTFRMTPLPVEAQISPIRGLLVDDYNGDGNLDILLSDNFYAPDATVIRYDAGLGLLLYGNGNGSFTSVEPYQSGFRLGCDSRSLVAIPLGVGHTSIDNVESSLQFAHDSILVIAACNNGMPATFTLQPASGSAIFSIRSGAKIDRIDLYFADGAVRRMENYQGQGYLSQSGFSSILPVSRQVTRLRLYSLGKLVEEITPTTN